MSDKKEIVEYVEMLESMVQDAYYEGFAEGRGGSWMCPEAAYNDSETSKELTKNLKEVV